jgi:hypothetical protein
MMRKVKKFRGGGMDARDYGKKSSPFSSGYKGAKTTVTQGSNNKKTVTSNLNVGNTNNNNAAKSKSIQIMGPGLSLAKGLIFDPYLKRSRMQKMKGESFFGKPKKLPTTKDYYRLTGEPFDPMSRKGVDYMKEVGLIKPTPPGGTPDDDPVQFCPDGTLPPCKISTPTKTPKPTTTQNKFLGNFKAYNSGGVSSGPPPKRGPNPQVPPVKMKSGKMNKMSCPHRPDGIRGMGAAIKGSKFIGVK